MNIYKLFLALNYFTFIVAIITASLSFLFESYGIFILTILFALLHTITFFAIKKFIEYQQNKIKKLTILHAKIETSYNELKYAINQYIEITL